HFVWVRMFAINSGADTIHVGLGPSPATTPPARTITAGSSGSWVWVRTAGINVAAPGTQFVSLFMADDGVRVDRLAVTRSAGVTAPALPLALNGGDWAFASNPDTYVAGTCNDR